MKTRKSNLIAAAILGALVALTPMSWAQQNQENDRRPDRPTTGQRERRGTGPAGGNALNRISEQLKLTDEQKTKLQPILREETTKLRELRQDTALTPEQRREKTQAIREQYLAKVKPVLTTEQFEQFKKMREQSATRGARGDRPARRGQNTGSEGTQDQH